MSIYLDRIQQAKETLRRNYPGLPAGAAGYTLSSAWDYIDLMDAVREFYYPEAETIDTQFDGVFYEV